ncbi:hypothetical protein WA158_002251 [Blastocystis sp. Blastoise]
MNLDTSFSFNSCLENSGLLIKVDEVKGRYIVANKIIPSGDDVLRAYPFVSVVDGGKDHQWCSCCLKTSSKMFQCSRCGHALYCSRECQLKDWQNHKLECKSLASIRPNKPTQTVLLLSRLLRCICTGDSGLYYENAEYHTGPMKNSQGTSEDILKLIYHEDTPRNEEDYANYQNICMLVRRLIRDESWVEDQNKKNNIYIQIENMIKLLLRMSSNVFTTLTDDLNITGIGIYPVASLFNHSCIPNCAVTFDHNMICIRAMKTIQKGEELTISYIDEHQPLYQRQKMLLHDYHFKCTCERCTHPILELENLFVSYNCPLPSCKGICKPQGDNLSIERTHYKCDKCHKIYDKKSLSDRLEKKIEIAQIINNDYEDSDRIEKQHHDICEQLAVYHNCVCDYNTEYLKLQNELLYILLQKQDMKNALPICNHMIDTYENIIQYEKQYIHENLLFYPILSLYYAMRVKIYHYFEDYRNCAMYCQVASHSILVTHGRKSKIFSEFNLIHEEIIQRWMRSEFQLDENYLH